MATRSRRRWPWLIAAALLFALAAWVTAGTEDEKTDHQQKVSIPRRMTSDDWERAEKRRTMPEPAPVMVEVGKPLPPVAPRDPVLALMPTEIKNGAVVVEANAIRNSDLGNLMVECVSTGNNQLAEMQDAGFDPLTNLDRMAVFDSTLIMTGDFSKTDFHSLMKATGRRDFGPNAEIFERDLGKGRVDSFGVWKDQVIVIGESLEDVTTALDRLDGKGDATARRVLTEADAYGELYGVIKARPLADGMAEENPQLARLLLEAASSIRLHADVSHDVGLVADVVGTDSAKTQDLRKALGTALTLAKLQAEAKGNKNEAEILGYAKVDGAKGGDSTDFRLEAGLPYDLLEKQLKRCIEEKKKRLAARESSQGLDGG